MQESQSTRSAQPDTAWLSLTAHDTRAWSHGMRVAFGRSEFAGWSRVVVRVAAFSALNYAFFTIGVLLALSDGMLPTGPPSAATRVGRALCTAFTLPLELFKVAVGGNAGIRDYRHIAFAGNCLCYGILLEFVWRRWRSIYRKRSNRNIPLCHLCGSNLTGNVSGRCPECGTLIPRS